MLGKWMAPSAQPTCRAADFQIFAPTPDATRALDQALLYLQTSPAGQALIQDLVRVPDLKIAVDLTGNTDNSFDLERNTLTWQPSLALAVRDVQGKVIGQRSPAMMLTLVAAQAIEVKRRLSPDGTFDAKSFLGNFEYTSVARVNAIARQLGEPQLLDYHSFDDSWIQTLDPTTTAYVTGTDSGLGYRTQTISSRPQGLPITLTYGFRDAHDAEPYLLRVDHIDEKTPRDQRAACEGLKRAGLTPAMQMALSKPLRQQDNLADDASIRTAWQGILDLNTILQDPAQTVATSVDALIAKSGLSFSQLLEPLPTNSISHTSPQPPQHHPQNLTRKNFKFVGKPTEDQLVKFDQALRYLQTSTAAASDLATAAARRDLVFAFNTAHKNGEFHLNGKDWVVWDPMATVSMRGDGNDGEMSPALALLHEIAHATDPNGALNIALTGLPGFSNAAEVYAVSREKLAGSELGEPSRRTYLDSSAASAQDNPSSRTLRSHDAAHNKVVTKTGFVGSAYKVVTQEFTGDGKRISEVSEVDNGLGYRTQTISNLVQGMPVTITYGFRGAAYAQPYVISLDAINGKVPQDPPAAQRLLRESGITPAIQLATNQLITMNLSPVRLQESPATVESNLSAFVRSAELKPPVPTRAASAANLLKMGM